MTTIKQLDNGTVDARVAHQTKTNAVRGDGASNQTLFSEDQRTEAGFWGISADLQLVKTSMAARLAGLSSQRLGDWARRGLIQPDIYPKKQGSPGRYSWQTVLRLRIAVILRDRFTMEMEAQRDQLFELSVMLAVTSFGDLWGKSLALDGGKSWTLIEHRKADLFQEDCLLLRLDPHLHVLSGGFSLSKPALFGRFPALRPDVKPRRRAK